MSQKVSKKSIVEDKFGNTSFNNKMTDTILLIDSNGLSHFTSYLAYGLSKFRNITLYGLSPEDFEITGAAKERNIKYYNVRDKLPVGNSIPKIIIGTLLFFFVLIRATALSKYEIVHIQGYVPTFFLFIPMLKLRRKKILWTAHDIDYRPSNKGIRGKLDSIYISISCEPMILRKYSDAIIVHGHDLKKQLLSKGIENKKIHVLPHFDYNYLLNYPNNPNFEFSEIGLLTNYVLFFGRIVPYKGLDALLNASRIINKYIGDDFILVIAGEGNISLIKSHMSPDQNAYIHIINRRIASRQIPDLLRGAKFLVAPYTYASQSGVISLAYTFSKPVIVSNVGSIYEYVEHGKTGLIFDSGNEQQLADCIIELIKNRNLCEKMGQNANQKLLSEMSLELYCNRVNYLYGTLLDRFN
jgi:glycosyltransferase involved in cell wall biosynthesis